MGFERLFFKKKQQHERQILNAGFFCFHVQMQFYIGKNNFRRFHRIFEEAISKI